MSSERPTIPRMLEPEAVEAWLVESGRRVVWFHARYDGPGAMALRAYRLLSAEVREILPLRLVDIDNLPDVLIQPYGLRHTSELMVYEGGKRLWQGVPFAGPGTQWEAWLTQWHS